MAGRSLAVGVRRSRASRGAGVLALLSALLLAGCGASQPAAPDQGGARSGVTREATYTSRVAALAPLTVGRDAWVAVSVATLWRSPGSPRPVDAPALAAPARIEQWLSSMTLAQRRGLSGRADTQALYGDRVRVIRLQPGWARVVVPSQPSPLDARGYPGWVPRRQLTTVTPAPSTRRATVTVRTVWLRTDQADSRRLFRISLGTRLPVRGTTARFVRVVAPTGQVRRLATWAVVVHDNGRPALAPSRQSLVGTARRFLGLPYLWAGLSGFGVDCSGLTWLDYRVHGIVIPRDALPQSRHGTRVGSPLPGDLMFYARSGVVHHVSMYVGSGRMIHAPGTGQSVQIIPTSAPAYRAEYAGARRYLR